MPRRHPAAPQGMPPRKFGIRQALAARADAEAGAEAQAPVQLECPPAKRRYGARQAASSSAAPTAATSADAAEDFKRLLGTLFLNNTLSGPATQQVAAGASRAGATGVAYLAKAGAGGTLAKNAHRDILRSLLRDSEAPPIYTAAVKMHDHHRNMDVLADLPFLLPHEVLGAMSREALRQFAADSQSSSYVSRQHQVTSSAWLGRSADASLCSLLSRWRATTCASLGRPASGP